MANILCFDTSTKSCTVALAIDGHVACVKESLDEGYSHSEKLNTYIKEVLEKSDISMSALHAVAVSKGPGSYTGLRIGVSTAKGLAYGLDIPLISIDTLKALSAQVSDSVNDDALLCPMLDARRMEVYTALFSKNLKTVSDIEAKIIEEDAFAEKLKDTEIHFFGNGMDKCREVLSVHPHAKFVDGIEPKAGSMCQLAERKFSASDFEDTAYFEPYYLKDFLATTPKKLL
jgi:tRNA threonylcarbamoyladenosine biosynthesis protein TsaB